MKAAPLFQVLSLATVLTLTRVAVSQQPVKLEYKLAPGTEILYRVETTNLYKSGADATLRQSSGKGTGVFRTVVVSADPKSGTALVSQLVELRTQYKTTMPDSEQNSERDTTYCKIKRVDRTGRVLPRAKPDEKYPSFVFDWIQNSTLDWVVLPAEPTNISVQWSSPVESMVGVSPMVATTKLTQIKQVEGRPCAVLQSVLSPRKEEQERTDAGEISGDGEAVFDLDRGLLLEMHSKVVRKFGDADNPGSSESSVVLKLDSVKSMPQAELAKLAKTAEAVDGALDKFLAGEADKCVEMLDDIKVEELAENWREGIRSVTSTAKQMQGYTGQEYAVRTSRESVGPSDAMLEEAQSALAAGRWSDAARKYEQFADKSPSSSLAPMALSEAAALCDARLNDAKKAADLRAKLIAMEEKKVADEPKDLGSLLILAQAYTDAGKYEPALTAYQNVLSADPKALPAARRLIASLRMGGVLEKMGKKEDAVKAYGAVATMPGDDNYCRKLKKEAAARAEKLQPAKP